MSSMSLFKEILSLDLKEQKEHNIDESDKNEDKEDFKEKESLIFQGNPSYPRIFWGESAKPLINGPYPESEYMDDNIHTTYKGLISYLG